jgi:hypothetical protein
LEARLHALCKQELSGTGRFPDKRSKIEAKRVRGCSTKRNKFPIRTPELKLERVEILRMWVSDMCGPRENIVNKRHGYEVGDEMGV